MSCGRSFHSFEASYEKLLLKCMSCGRSFHSFEASYEKLLLKCTSSEVLDLWMEEFIYLFIYLGFYVAFNTVQVISRRVVGRAEETSTYSSLGLCTVDSQET